METATRNSRLEDTERDWMACSCPLKVSTHSPERQFHMCILPSEHPVAKNLDTPSQACHSFLHKDEALLVSPDHKG